MSILIIGLLVWIAPAIVLAVALIWVRLRSGPSAQPSVEEPSGSLAADRDLIGRTAHAPVAAE
uniref:hypothetical protein n=1 Tax=uncultured Sphingomonas sp. TaxID=158754 RepID=UPI0025DD43BA|nr:hypothetical protein [uncultured Sphingomonas sp.]